MYPACLTYSVFSSNLFYVLYTIHGCILQISQITQSFPGIRPINIKNEHLRSALRNAFVVFLRFYWPRLVELLKMGMLGMPIFNVQGSNADEIMRDMGKSIMLLTPQGNHYALLRLVQLVDGPITEGVPNNWDTNGQFYVCTWSADPTTINVTVTRTG